MQPRWIIGLASGASGEGVDAALLALQGGGLDVRVAHLHGLHQPFPADLRDRVRQVATATACDPREISQLHRLLGETFAAAARAAADVAGLPLPRVLCLGLGGCTVGHDPEGRFPAVIELGMAPVVAERCGVTVVSDLRSRDLAAGGQGAPLAALPDYLLFRHPDQGRLLLHLGGLARLVYLPPGCRVGEVVGFEAAPCNLLLNTLVRHLTSGREAFDTGGKYAVQGRCVEPLLQEWLAHPALQRRPPRCLPRHTFGEEFALSAIERSREHGASLHDLLCTATHFVARGITGALRRFLPAARIDRVLLTGGGVRNGFLWHLLEQQLAGHVLARTDEVGIPAELRQPSAYGLLAALTLDGVPGNVPGVTGASGGRLLGSLTPGAAGNWARCLAWMAQHARGPTSGHAA